MNPMFKFTHEGKRGAFYAPDFVEFGGMGFQVSAIRSRQLALTLLRAYLAEFINKTDAMAANQRLVSSWSNGLLDQALDSLGRKTADLKRAEYALSQAAGEAAEPVIAWPGDTETTIQAARAERAQIAGAVAMAQSILVLAVKGGAA